MTRAYFDSDVLIWHLRGKEEARGFFNSFFKDELYEMWIGAMQRAEVVFFMRDDEENETLSFLSYFKCDIVNQEIIDLAGHIFRKWKPSHGIDTKACLWSLHGCG